MRTAVTFAVGLCCVSQVLTRNQFLLSGKQVIVSPYSSLGAGGRGNLERSGSSEALPSMVDPNDLTTYSPLL